MSYETADPEKTQAPIDERELFLAEKRKRDRDRDCCVEAARPMTPNEIVAQLFTYHAPNETTIPKFAAINQAAKNFAEIVLANCPSGPDRTRAIEAIRAARMLANSAISLNGLSLY
jgi:hypothetical protein